MIPFLTALMAAAPAAAGGAFGATAATPSFAAAIPSVGGGVASFAPALPTVGGAMPSFGALPSIPSFGGGGGGSQPPPAQQQPRVALPQIDLSRPSGGYQAPQRQDIQVRQLVPFAARSAFGAFR